jgi:hypothetical protein
MITTNCKRTVDHLQTMLQCWVSITPFCNCVKLFFYCVAKTTKHPCEQSDVCYSFISIASFAMLSTVFLFVAKIQHSSTFYNGMILINTCIIQRKSRNEDICCSVSRSVRT